MEFVDILSHPTALAALIAVVSAVSTAFVWALSYVFVKKSEFHAHTKSNAEEHSVMNDRLDKLEHGHEILVIGPLKELTTAIQAVVASLDKLDGKSEVRHDKVIEAISNLDRRLIRVEESGHTTVNVSSNKL